MLGGRTNHWGRISLRNGPYDFKPRARDGLGFDWPITYEDIAPYYDKVEMLIGVYGANDGLENTPDSPPGCLLPPPKPRVSELLIAQKRAGSWAFRWLPGIARCSRSSSIASTSPAKLHPGNPQAQRIVAEQMSSRAACFWATPCGRGCSIGANYQSTTVHLPPALATGKLDIVTDAMVREVTLGTDGQASGVSFIDKTHRQAEPRGRASRGAGGERLRDGAHPAQLEVGAVPARPRQLQRQGRQYLMDTVGAASSGQIPLLENLPPHNEDGAGGGHMYAPWWLYKEQLAGKLGFARGYHIEFGGGRRMPGVGTAAGLEWLTGGSYGQQVQGGRAALLRLVRRLRRPRRDDPERGLLLRDRSAT